MARAMAASTWFQGSACPPGVQGTMPEGNCHSAMASTVARRSAAESTPGTSGIVRSADTSGLRGGGADGVGCGRRRRLGGVDDEALAQHGVEDAFGPASELGGFLDVPHQQLQV